MLGFVDILGVDGEEGVWEPGALGCIGEGAMNEEDGQEADDDIVPADNPSFGTAWQFASQSDKHMFLPKCCQSLPITTKYGTHARSSSGLLLEANF